MKNRHRVSQVVSKLSCSTGGQRKLLKQSAADRGEYREVAGVIAETLAVVQKRFHFGKLERPRCARVPMQAL
jgi:hypothetical protein